MILSRKILIVGILVLLCVAGFIGYTQYDLWVFRNQYSDIDMSKSNNGMHPELSRDTQTTPDTDIDVVQQTEQDEQKTDTESIVDIETEQTESDENLQSATDTSDENKLTDAEIDAIIDEAFDFKFSDLESMKQSLLDGLLSRYGTDERVFRLVDLWEASHHIIKKVNQYNQRSSTDAREVSELMDMLPGYIFKEAGEVAISLFGHGEEKASQIRQDAEKIEEGFNQIDMGLVAGPIVEEAYRNGEITIEEAKIFFKATTGMELKIIKEE